MSVDRRPPYLQNGQFIFSIMEVTNELWLRSDAIPLRYPCTYRTAAFANIAILISPSYYQKLTPVKMAFGLLLTKATILDADRSLGSVFVMMQNLPSGDSLGTLHIWDDTIPGNGLQSFNKTSAITISPDSYINSNLTITTGLAIADNSTFPTVWSTLTADPPRPISDTDWLTVFTASMGRAFSRSSHDLVSSLLNPPNTRYLVSYSKDQKVKCEVRFYDKAFDPTSPMRIADFVQGMLTILRPWARNNVWHEGWSGISLDGETQFMVQISRRTVAIGDGNEVATT